MTPLPSSSTPHCLLLTLPPELQVNLLTFLRAFDLSSMQQTCRFYASPTLMDAIVRHAADRVYPHELSRGYDQQPVQYQRHADLFTVEHLRNMELVVIARVLSRPEPTSGGGFIVSKSWCKAALRWLEVQEQQRQQAQPKKKLNRKQRVRSRRLSEVSPPWPNVNSDILCEHANLVCMSNKSSRARRRLLDRQAWKALSNLYPDSTPIDALVGECLQCRSAAQSAKEDAALKEQQLVQQRKKPLGHPAIRQFYTRTRGIPMQALLKEEREQEHQKPKSCCCLLQDGVYVILPRVWCQGWRRYIKTGEVENNSSGGATSHNPANKSSMPTSATRSSAPLLPSPPDASCLLCDAHRLPLFPAHLEGYLHGHTDYLFANNHDSATAVEVSAQAAARANPVGQEHPVDQAVLQALQAAGLGPAEVSRQLQAMRILEYERNSSSFSSNNNSAYYTPPEDLVEILTEQEYTALLEEQRWSGSTDAAERVSFTVIGGMVLFSSPSSSPPCRVCHLGARRYCGGATAVGAGVAGRSNSNANDLKRSSTKQKKHRGGTKVARSNASLAPASLEY